MRAECTWGDGPDVLVVLEGTPIMLYENPVNVSEGKDLLKDIPRDDDKLCWCTNGLIRQGSFELTAHEAFMLAGSLMSAANVAIGLDVSYREYVEKEQSLNGR